MEKVASVKNPLTIIAVFAGIAEVSGTVVLPFIAPENQFVYIWFLMLFPTLLVVLFFAILHWNRNALYAPSDFQDEKHYVDQLRPATAKEILEKHVEQSVEAKRYESQIILPEPVVSSSHTHYSEDPSSPDGENIRPSEAKKLIAVDLNSFLEEEKIKTILSTLGDETGLEFEANVAIRGDKKVHVADAAAITEDRFIVVEIYPEAMPLKIIQGAVLNMKKIHSTLLIAAGTDFRLIIAIMRSEMSEEQIPTLQQRMRSLLPSTPFPVDIRVF